MNSIPSKIIDKDLYLKVKDEIRKKIPKSSIFRSLQIIKEYKKRGGRINHKEEKKSKLMKKIKETNKNKKK